MTPEGACHIRHPPGQVVLNSLGSIAEICTRQRRRFGKQGGNPVASPSSHSKGYIMRGTSCGVAILVMWRCRQSPFDAENAMLHAW